MIKRILQIGCLVVLGLVATSRPMEARSMWSGPCVGPDCDQCRGAHIGCWTEFGSCQDYGCDAFAFCGEDDGYVQCDCPNGCPPF
jgi:hypothetical protein